ncbi:MAG: hypothetical protein P4L16_07670 [Chlamydiales bacterium]|nr:hypothetical protein [Chlamydiales bacterium]
MSSLANTMSYILTTEVKGKEIHSIENFANMCLKPAQYLWNGKKVELIQRDEQLALQTDFIYQLDERSWKKCAIMVVLLIPGVIIGIALKAYAMHQYHAKGSDEFIKKCLNKDIGTVYVSKGQNSFGKLVSGYIQKLKLEENDLKNRKIIFLSEVDYIALRNETHHCTSYLQKTWITKFSTRNFQVNGDILRDVDLLWNLGCLNLADRQLLHDDKVVLIKMNPMIVQHETTTHTRTEPKRANKLFDLNAAITEPD